MNLKPETLARIDEVIPHYPSKRSATLPLLHLIQEDVGYIPQEAIEWVAARLELQPINVYEVVTFYPMFRQKPIGRRHVKVCRTLSCALLGAYRTCEAFEREFIIKALKMFKGRINQTALHANIPKKTLLRKIEKYGINARDYVD